MKQRASNAAQAKRMTAYTRVAAATPTSGAKASASSLGRKRSQVTCKCSRLKWPHRFEKRCENFAAESIEDDGRKFNSWEDAYSFDVGVPRFGEI